MSEDKRPASVVSLVPKGTPVDEALADFRKSMASMLELEALLAKKTAEKFKALVANGFTRAEALDLIKAEKD
mgnify:CR=1 FL=1